MSEPIQIAGLKEMMATPEFIRLAANWKKLSPKQKRQVTRDAIEIARLARRGGL